MGGLLAGGCASACHDEGRPVSDAESWTTAQVSSPGVKVCELVGRDSIVQVMSTEMGTRYTLCTADGEMVASNLDASGLAKLRPDLNPESIQADWGRGPLMLADERE